MFEAAARSGIVSRSVPSRSIVTAFTRSGKAHGHLGSRDLCELRAHRARSSPRNPACSKIAEPGDERVGAGVARSPRCCRPSRRRRPRARCRARCGRCARAPRAALSSASGMNFCPPKPGFTDMMSTRSSLSQHVIEPGERRRRVQHEPRLAARIAWMSPIVRSTCSLASGWNEMMFAPAFAKSGTMRSTGFTMRCTSIGTVHSGAIASHTQRPDREVRARNGCPSRRSARGRRRRERRPGLRRQGARSPRTECSVRCGRSWIDANCTRSPRARRTARLVASVAIRVE